MSQPSPWSGRHLNRSSSWSKSKPGVIALADILTAVFPQCQDHGRVEQPRMVLGGLVPCETKTVKEWGGNCSCVNIRDNWSYRRDCPLLLGKGAGYAWERDRSRALSRKQAGHPRQCRSVRSAEDKAAPPALSTLQEGSLGQALAKPRGPLIPGRTGAHGGNRPQPHQG